MSEPGPVFPDDVDVAIVSHNGRTTLPRVIECLNAAGMPADRLTLVDIASTDDTLTWFSTACPAARILRLDANVGPNPARNLAIRNRTRSFVLLLDSDAYVRPDTIARLRSAMDPSAAVGLVVPVVVHEDRPDRIQYASGALHFLCEAVGAWQDRPLAERGANREDIGTAPGLCCLVDASVASRLGGYDERYFMGKEDGEFCYRLRLAGYRLVEDPRAVVLHASRPRSTWLFPFQIRNRWHFMLKNYELRTLLILIPALLIHEPLQMGLLAARGHLGAWMRGLRDLLSWLPSLGEDRRAVRDLRRRHDRDLLRAAPLLMRPDMVGGSFGNLMKRAYDAWLQFYWGVARHLV